MFVEQNDLNEWKQTLSDYQTIRRPKVPKVENHKRITSKEIKFKEKEFDPILQQYLNSDKDKQLVDKSNTYYKKQQEAKSGHLKKYDREYDIVNLGPSSHPDLKTTQGAEFKNKLNLIVPTIKDYNIITNQKMDPNMFKNIKALKEEKVYNKKFDESRLRDFDIISGIFHKDNEQKVKQEIDQNNEQLNQKLSKRNFDFLKGKFYDDEKERQYQEKQKEIQKQKEKDAILKLPPSLRFRESIIQDPTKEVPEEIKKLDQIRENKKKRYQLRYAVEGEYHERDQQAKQRQLERKLNRLNHEKYLKERQKGFDIITLEKLDNQQFEKWIHKKANAGVWDQIQQTGNYLHSDKENDKYSHQSVQEGNQNNSKQNLEPFEGKKIQAPRFRVTQSLQRKQSENGEINNNFKQTGSSIQRKTFAQTGINSFGNSNSNNNNLRQNSNYGATFQQSFKQKQYLDDPRNATTQLNEPKIKPQIQQQIKRIKTGGFMPSDEQYSQKTMHR
ncbi:hypothetical protein PPERSA_03054 [Pseudocohnilembus persalinus]|uniref:Uncharacterized protein n=1 Tax=Pseudocohnilembus persalinus TaxID=266149 RepID=A0A0V0R923_PSEPJ|nr:hypothetical protein PPERSA_03054 [Pseudocohnilembus persalinus]|eukprot:KRX10996.1 hypothetical protein PPERSA_03054 [Pseudocohnilembus persalinus]